jgi:uncharacterized protein (TIGR00730 family)
MPLADRPQDPQALKAEQALDAAAPSLRRADDPSVVAELDALIAQMGGVKQGTMHARLIRELLQTGLKLAADDRDLGELKLITNSFKELRYALKVFGRFKQPHKITIFGSARTPETHPDYAACVEFSKLMADAGWMSITGAGMGIMKAGHVGPGRDASFGVAIRLPFETNANEVIQGDEKLIHFRYFFTRKLMFISQAEAVALFPGGFGTQDEAFEALTLIQTGRSTPMPVVLVEGEGGEYWKGWDQFIRRQLLDRHWISPEDPELYYIAKDPRDAAEHVLRFYRNYHSSRYVRDEFVIRLKQPLKDEDVARLEQEFKVLIKTGGLAQRGPLEGEEDSLHLPRLVFTHTKHKFGLVHRLIDRINECD